MKRKRIPIYLIEFIKDINRLEIMNIRFTLFCAFIFVVIGGIFTYLTGLGWMIMSRFLLGAVIMVISWSTWRVITRGIVKDEKNHECNDKNCGS